MSEPIRTNYKYYVARTKGKGKKPLYAALGINTGMGRVIVHVSLRHAKKANSPAGLMYGFLGGHYKGYKAVEVHETVLIEETVVKWPPEDEVFDR